MRILSPGCSGWGPRSGSSFRYVPFVEPRSSRTMTSPCGASRACADDATGMHVASAGLGGESDGGDPKLRVETAAGLRAGSAYSLAEGAVLGRGEQADIQLQDTFASSQHARLAPHGDVMVLEDLGSTNGTYLNEEPLRGPQPLHPGDKIRIGDSSFTFER